MAKAKMSAMESLHDSLANHFVSILESGDVDSKDVGNILKFLKDNDITVDAVESTPMQSILDQFKMNREELEDSLNI